MTASSRWNALGTSAEVFVSDDTELTRARRIVQDELEAMELACSRSREDSELARVNASPGTWVEVSRLLFATVQTALAVASTTDGDANPTVGRALRVAGYDRGPAELPALRTGRVRFTRAPAWRLVQVDAGRLAVRVPRGVELDLDTTARTLAVDRAARACAKSLRGGALVGVGGDLAVGGAAPEGGWPVRVTRDHKAGFDAPGQTVSITSGGLATSCVDLAEPKENGVPIQGFWRIVSVAAASCLAAQVATTVSLVRGGEALFWLDRLRLPARLVGLDDTVVRVAGWPDDALA
jgi:thiamine biosynthesis lipoprotein